MRFRPLVVPILLVLAAPTAAGAEPAAPTQGQMIVLGDEVEALPLQKTEVEASIDGFVSRVTVRQVFGNPYEQPIEAMYVFPLPHKAAVSDMTMHVGKRVIHSDVQKRDDARKTYEEAKREGKTAALLEQQRPNVFTQSVANILPKQEVVVEIVYDDLLAYEDGNYEFTFPMVVGPRYNPVGVEDAEAISPPVTPKGTRTGSDISIAIDLDPGVKVKNLESPTHSISVSPGTIARKPSVGPFDVDLAAKKTIPNKDFVLRWQVAGTKPQMALLTHKGDLGGYFALMLQPPATIAPEAAAPKEIVFVLDTSGSMGGTPMDIVKRAMRHAIENLNPNDTFRIVRFSNAASALSDKPMRKTKANVKRALAYIDGIRAGGGTEMLTGIREAMEGDPPDGRVRMIFFMSDGYIGNETQIFRAIRDELGEDARLFTMGVGSSVNRYLIDGMAEQGKGSPYYALLDEEPEPQVAEFYARIANPVMTHVDIDWGDLAIEETTQQASVDLFVGQPLWIVGRYDEAGEATVKVSGRVGKDAVSYELPVSLPADKGGASSLPQLWARTFVEELSDADKITELGLTYRIATKYTSFVAVEDKVVNEGGLQRKIKVPVEMPAGVSYEGVYGAGAPPQVSQDYSKNVPVAGRSYTTSSSHVSFSGSTSLENAYYVDSDSDGGGEVIAISGSRHVPKTLRIGGGVAVGSIADSDLDTRSSATMLHLRLSRPLTRSWGAAGRLSFVFPGGDDYETLASLMLEAMYLPLFGGHFMLTAGAGVLMPSESDLGLAYMAGAEIPFDLVGRVDMAVQLRYDRARLFGDDGRSMSSLGIGVGIDW